MVRAHEYRETFLLIGECRELGADPFVWRTHLLEGLDRLLGDSVGIVAEGQRTGRARSVDPSLVVDRGWDCDSSRRRWLDYMRSMGPGADPNCAAFLARFVPPYRTAVRRQYVGDREHYASDYYRNYLSSVQIDDSLYSFHELPDGSFDALTLHRRSGDRPWSPRDVELLTLVHREVATMVDRELASGNGHSQPLAPRLQETLDATLDGLSEKEIAARMRLSEHTVHQYVKALYRRYRVRSRAELMSLWILRHRRRGRT
jgi:DNA-binding CsgD family transcriptional regulator